MVKSLEILAIGTDIVVEYGALPPLRHDLSSRSPASGYRCSIRPNNSCCRPGSPAWNRHSESRLFYGDAFCRKRAIFPLHRARWRITAVHSRGRLPRSETLRSGIPPSPWDRTAQTRRQNDRPYFYLHLLRLLIEIYGVCLTDGRRRFDISFL